MLFLDRRARWAAALVGLAFGARLYLDLVNPFSYLHGYLEAYYTIVGRAFNHDSLHPNFLGWPHYYTPPLTAYNDWIWGTLLHGWVLADRIPALVAFVGLIVAGLSWGLTYDKDPWFRAILFSTTPWLFLWMGRGQPDTYLTFCVVAFALSVRKGNSVMAGLSWGVGLFAKQTMILVLPMVLMWPREPGGNSLKKLAKSMALCTIPIALWYLSQPLGVVLDQTFRHPAYQHPILSNAPRVLVYGYFVGAGAVLALWAVLSPNNRPIWISMMLYLLFALAVSADRHEYYTLPAIALMCLLVPHWREWPRYAKWIQVVSAPVGLVLVLLYAGELGPQILHEAMMDAPAGSYIQEGYSAQAMLWGRTDLKHDSQVGCPAGPNRTVTCGFPIPGCEVTKVYHGWGAAIYQNRC